MSKTKNEVPNEIAEAVVTYLKKLTTDINTGFNEVNPTRDEALRETRFKCVEENESPNGEKVYTVITLKIEDYSREGLTRKMIKDVMKKCK
jgi:hypothetical protein